MESEKKKIKQKWLLQRENTNCLRHRIATHRTQLHSLFRTNEFEKKRREKNIPRQMFKQPFMLKYINITKKK